MAIVLALYVLATCASSLVSSHRTVRWLGVATALSLAAASAFYAAWFISVWCSFAAAISAVGASTFSFRRSPSPRLPAGSADRRAEAGLKDKAGTVRRKRAGALERLPGDVPTWMRTSEGAPRFTSFARQQPGRLA